MQYIAHYTSPIGGVTLESDGESLSGLWFDGQKYYAGAQESAQEAGDLPVFRETIRWLSVYFSGNEPDFSPPLVLCGSVFRKTVWEMLLQIPYGRTVTYGELAQQVAKTRGIGRMSAQAVGGAVGHNAIALLIPCHRVIGADGSLTGYAAGIEKKEWLLRLERVPMNTLFIPKRGSAL